MSHINKKKGVHNMFNIPTDPQGIGKVLDSGIKLFRSSFKSILGILTILFVIGLLPYLFIGPTYLAMFNTNDPEAQMRASMMMFSYWWIYIVILLLSLAVTNALIIRIHGIASNSIPSIGSAIKSGTKKILPVIIATILYIVIVGLSYIPAFGIMALSQGNTILFTIGALLLVIPATLSLSLCFFYAAILIDDSGIFSSLAESQKLIWKGIKGGNWWRTFFILLVAGLIYYIFMIVVSFITIPLIGSEPVTGLVLSFLITNLVYVLVSPILFTVYIATYYDLKVRSSGSDLGARIDD